MKLKKTIAYFSLATSNGGSEVYLEQLIKSIDESKYNILLFCFKKHPFVDSVECAILQKLQFVFLDELLGNSEPEINSFLIDKSIVEIKRNMQRVKNNLLKKVWHLLPFYSLKLIAGTMKDIFKLKKTFQQYKINLIHFNDTGCEPPVIAAKLARIPIKIGTYHVLPDYEKTDWVHRIIEFFSVRCLNEGIAVSRATKDAWVKRTRIKANKIKVIYNGVDLRKFNIDTNTTEFRDSLNITVHDKVICILARLHPMKGHKYLFEAIPRIIQNISNAKFLLVGDGPLRKEFESIILANKLEGSVFILGHRNDIPKLLSCSDLVVLPSIMLETFSYALIESMACKKPVVASDFSGIPEVVEDNVTGVLVPPKDSNELAYAIIKLCQDEGLRKKMGEAGRKRVEELFREERMVKDTYAFYDELLFRYRNKFRVAVTASGLEGTKRGVESWAKELAKTLNDKGVDAILYKGSNPSTQPLEKKERIAYCIPRDSFLCKFIKRILPSFVWHFGLGSTYDIEQLSFAISFIVANIFKQYDIIHTQDPLVARIFDKLNKLNFTKSKVILAHGTNESIQFISQFRYVQHLTPCTCISGKSKNFIIPNFVDTDIFSPSMESSFRRKFLIPQDAFVILSVGAITLYKRIEYLITEIEKLKQIKNKEIFLVIVGASTPETKKIIDDKKKNREMRIIFLIDQPFHQMAEIYGAADVFALCSLYETFGNVFIEAMASGLPAVGHKHPIIEHVIGDGGDCIDMSKDGELAQTLQKYLNINYRKEKGIKARQQAVNNFSKEVVVQRIIRMYHEISICNH